MNESPAWCAWALIKVAREAESGRRKEQEKEKSEEGRVERRRTSKPEERLGPKEISPCSIRHRLSSSFKSGLGRRTG